MSSMVTKRIGRLKHESHDYGMYKISRIKTLWAWIWVLLDEQVSLTFFLRISEPHIIIHLLNDCFSYFIYIKTKYSFYNLWLNRTITCMQQSWMHSFINLRNHYKKEINIYFIKNFAIIPNKNNCKIVTT